MSLKSIILTLSILSCSLSLVKAVDFPDEWPEEGGDTKTKCLVEKPQSSYSRLFVLKHRDFFYPRHK